MTKTKLISRVLQKLKVLAMGEDVAPEDSALVSEFYDEVYEELKQKGVATWSSVEDIPSLQAQQVIKIVASRCADDFEHEELNTQRLLLEESQAMIKLDEYIHVPYVSASETESY